MSARAAFAFVSRARTITDDLLIAPFRYYNAVLIQPTGAGVSTSV